MEVIVFLVLGTAFFTTLTVSRCNRSDDYRACLEKSQSIRECEDMKP